MHRKPLAFTLIELLVVIVIIAVLASLLMSSLAGARERQKQTVCASRLRQLAISLELYAVEHDASYPIMYSKENNYTTWREGIFPYLPKVDRSDQIFNCPAAGEIDKTKYQSSIGLNTCLQRVEWDYKKLRIEHPSNTILLGDMPLDNLEFAYPSDNWASTYDQWYYAGWSRFNVPPNTEFRHGGKTLANVVYCDGHVAALKPEELTRNSGRWNWFDPVPK